MNKWLAYILMVLALNLCWDIPIVQATAFSDIITIGSRVGSNPWCGPILGNPFFLGTPRTRYPSSS